jgi:hypothetical protein
MRCHFPRIVLSLLPIFALGLAGCGSSSSSHDLGSAGGGAAGSAGSASGGAAGSVGSGGSGAGTPTVDSLVSTPASSASEDEPSIAVTAQGRVVLAWDDRMSGSFQVAVRVSDDGGQSWAEIQPIPLGADQNVAANTSLSAAPDGTVYLAWGAEKVDLTTGVRSKQGVYFATLAPDANAFGPAVEVTDQAVDVGVYDQPFIAVTSTGLFLGYSMFPPSLMSAEMVTRFSEDGGKTWSTSTLPSSGPQSFMNGVQLCRPASGDRAYLYVVDGDLGLALWRSDDGGKTWPSHIQLIDQDEYAYLTFMRDGNCVADGDDVWVLYNQSDDAALSNHQKIARSTNLRLAHSADGGQSIESRSEVGDATKGPYFLLSRLALEENGALDVAYYAGSGDGDANASYRWGRSTDGGKTFPSQALRSPVQFEQSRITAKFLGDYMGLAWKDGRLFSAFVDNSGVSHIVLHAEDRP